MVRLHCQQYWLYFSDDVQKRHRAVVILMALDCKNPSMSTALVLFRRQRVSKYIYCTDPIGQGDLDWYKCYVLFSYHTTTNSI